MLKTNIPEQIRKSANEESVSVIHAPESFHSWVGLRAPLALWASSVSLTLADLDGTHCRAGTAKRKELSQGLECHRNPRRA